MQSNRGSKRSNPYGNTRDNRGNKRQYTSTAVVPYVRVPTMPNRSRVLPGQLRALAPEVKALDLPAAAYGLNTTFVVTPLNLIQTGSSFFNRIGRRIEMKSIRVSGNLQTLGSQVSHGYTRIMIVYDRQTNGALPSAADILQSTKQDGTNVTNSYSGLNLNNRDRFVVLRDMRTATPPINVTAGTVTFEADSDPVSPFTNIDMYVKLKGLVTQYKADSTPAVIGDISSGGLYLITFGNFAGGSEGWEAYVETRLRFADN